MSVHQPTMWHHTKFKPLRCVSTLYLEQWQELAIGKKLIVSVSRNSERKRRDSKETSLSILEFKMFCVCASSVEWTDVRI